VRLFCPTPSMVTPTPTLCRMAARPASAEADARAAGSPFPVPRLRGGEPLPRPQPGSHHHPPQPCIASLVRVIQAQLPDEVCAVRRLGADATAKHLAPTPPTTRRRPGLVQHPLAQRLLREARAIHDNHSGGISASVSARSPLTGEPDAGAARPVRRGGRSGNGPLSTPIGKRQPAGRARGHKRHLAFRTPRATPARHSRSPLRAASSHATAFMPWFRSIAPPLNSTESRHQAARPDPHQVVPLSVRRPRV